MKNITKVFPGVKALDNVSFNVRKGEIHALVGENGAGKSTLMNVLSGIFPHKSYEGTIILDGKECKFAKIQDSEGEGIAIIHQELALIPGLSIGENIFLGNERGSAARIDWDETYHKADEHLAMVGLKESSQTLVRNISVGKQQLVEIAKALSKNVRLLILDEPTASLNEDDSQKLLKLLLDFKTQGMTSVLISHKLHEVEQIADRITRIRDGAVIETLDRSTDQISENRIIKGMVGRELKDRFPARPASEAGEIGLEVNNWTVYHPLYTERKVCDDISLSVRKGEVVGISGLMGVGRTELAMSIFGKSFGTKISGQLKINGEEVVLPNIRSAIDKGLAYVTEDRKTGGLVLGSPVRMNTTLANLPRVSNRMKVINADKEKAEAKQYADMLGVKCSGIEQQVVNLSGGNQQKVLLSKWMFAEPQILILDEPTRGIDVGAKYEIYTIINDLVAQKKSVIVISSDMPELLGMCDRIYVMNEGRIVAEFTRETASQEAIMASILKSGKGA
jgi:putative multiple sugar transport system ATP-binding protein